MKSITVRIEEEDYERLRERAYRERGSVGGKAGEILRAALRLAAPQLVTEAKKEVVKPEEKNEGSEEEKEKGVEVSLAIPVNTVKEAEERVKEMVERKQGGPRGEVARAPLGMVPGYGEESEEARLKRYLAANKEQVKRGAGK
jgi:hypothetical protein